MTNTLETQITKVNKHINKVKKERKEGLIQIITGTAVPAAIVGVIAGVSGENPYHSHIFQIPSYFFSVWGALATCLGVYNISKYYPEMHKDLIELNRLIKLYEQKKYGKAK